MLPWARTRRSEALTSTGGHRGEAVAAVVEDAQPIAIAAIPGTCRKVRRSLLLKVPPFSSAVVCTAQARQLSLFIFFSTARGWI
eukprot:960808-Prorocentrum_minimum.AAC.2